MTIRSILLALLLAACAFSADFSGSWKMDPAKSDFGLLPMPDSVTLDVKQSESSIQVKFAQEGGRAPGQYTHEYATGGKESVNQLMGSEMKTVVAKKGDALEFTGKVSYRGRDLTIKDLWTLAQDGKSMLYKRTIASAEVTFEATMTMIKQ